MTPECPRGKYGFEGDKLPLSFEGLLLDGDIVPDASYYVGLPARTRDVDGRRLFKIYTVINETYGFSTANDFARMIKDSPSLSGSEVVSSVKALAQNNWIYDPEKFNELKDTLRDDMLIDVEDGDAYDLLKNLSELLSTDDSDETDLIKDQFLELLEDAGIEVIDPS